MKRRELLEAGVAGAVSAAAATLLPSMAAAALPLPAARRNEEYAHQTRNRQDERQFREESKRIYDRHFAQTRETVNDLKKKYAKPIFGPTRVWDMIDKLALCVDASDYYLACTNQLIHVQQIVEGMERDGVTGDELYLAALTHDLGKVLMLHGEAQENVVCANRPIGEYAAGAGLEHVVFQWNHDEFIYSRLKDHLPEHLGWLVRYHSISIEPSRPYMNERDQAYLEKYLVPFRKYDLGTKSTWNLPPPGILDKYRELIDKTFPSPVPI